MPSNKLFVDIHGWGNPSLSPHSIAAEALFRLADIPVDVFRDSSALMTSRKVLPVAKIGEGGERVISGIDAIIMAMKKTQSLPCNPGAGIGAGGGINATSAGGGSSADASTMTKMQKAEADAFVALCESTLEHVRCYEWFWIDENYFYHVKKAIAAPHYFPMSLIAPATRRNAVKNPKTGLLHTKEDLEEAYLLAENCYNALSIRLGSHKSFFYGDHATYLDAIVYSHLSLHLFNPLPKSKLKNMLSGFPNLVAFCNNFRDRYMKDIVIEPQRTKSNEGTGTDTGSRAKEKIVRTAKEAAEKYGEGENGDKEKEKAPVLDEKEIARKQRNKIFIGLVVLSFVFTALSGEVISFEGFEASE